MLKISEKMKPSNPFRGLKIGRRCRLLIVAAALVGFVSGSAGAGALLDEVVDFTGVVLYYETGVPGLLIGAVRGEETAVVGFGETAKGSGRKPDGKTLLRIGSITKSFTGEILARLASIGTVGLTTAERWNLEKRTLAF